MTGGYLCKPYDEWNNATYHCAAPFNPFGDVNNCTTWPAKKDTIVDDWFNDLFAYFAAGFGAVIALGLLGLAVCIVVRQEREEKAKAAQKKDEESLLSNPDSIATWTDTGSLASTISSPSPSSLGKRSDTTDSPFSLPSEMATTDAESLDNSTIIEEKDDESLHTTTTAETEDWFDARKSLDPSEDESTSQGAAQRPRFRTKMVWKRVRVQVPIQEDE